MPYPGLFSPSVSGVVSRCCRGSGRSTGDRQFLFINSRPCDLPKVECHCVAMDAFGYWVFKCVLSYLKMAWMKAKQYSQWMDPLNFPFVSNQVSRLLNECYRQVSPHQYPFYVLNFQVWFSCSITFSSRWFLSHSTHIELTLCSYSNCSRADSKWIVRCECHSRQKDDYASQVSFALSAAFYPYSLLLLPILIFVAPILCGTEFTLSFPFCDRHYVERRTFCRSWEMYSPQFGI